MLIFEKSQSGRRATSQSPKAQQLQSTIPAGLLRKNKPLLPGACLAGAADTLH